MKDSEWAELGAFARDYVASQNRIAAALEYIARVEQMKLDIQCKVADRLEAGLKNMAEKMGVQLPFPPLESPSPIEWAKAFDHVKETLATYQSLRGEKGVNVEWAINHVLTPLLDRFEGGERTKELHSEMMAVQ